MKHIFLILLLVSLVNVFGQTETEKKSIIKNYNIENIDNLAQSLIILNKTIKKEIEDYATTHNLLKSFTDNNKSHIKIKYILDGKPVYVTTNNEKSAISTRTNFLHNGGGLGLNIEGQNMHVATWDGGPTLSTHQEFLNNDFLPISRVTTPDASASNSQSDHSTHVSGTIIAKGTQANAKGMAPQATLTSFDWDNDNIEVLNQATTNGLLLSNHSYGIPILNSDGSSNAPTWLMGNYNSEAAIWDNVAFNAPYYLMVTSAGNDGETTYTGGLANNYDKLTGNKNSKNNLVVANANNPLINPNGSGTMLSIFINTSSSQGPTDDGRIKPDITADGTNVISPISTNNSSYGNFTGTSMSAPNTTGSLLLLQQYYNQINSNFMKASTLKGLVCHTADDNTQSPGPEPIFGWGLLNTKVAAETILNSSNGVAIIKESTLNNGQSFTMQVSVTSGQLLSATMCWTDPPGTAKDGQLNSSIPSLVNDLDIRIIDSQNNTYFPWKLLLSDVTGLAVQGDNIVDNLENIDIENAPAGIYTITVSHKGNLTNSLQDYSLIITGSNLVSLSTENPVDSKVSVWPNPSHETLYFSFMSNFSSKIKISLIDVQGRVVYFKEQNTGNLKNIEGLIDVRPFTSGLYFLTIQDGNSLFNKRIIIN